MLFKLVKKVIAAMLVFAICIGFTSCSKKSEEDTSQITKVDANLYEEVTQIQDNILLLDSGKLDITSQADSTKNTEISKADFVFDVTDDGKLTYIQYQYDKKGKIIACEFSDGITIEQWLIGNGWCTMSTNPYTAENTHRYLQLLSTTPTIEAINTITLEEKTSTDLYTLDLNVEELNNTTYKESEIEVQNELVEISVDKEGEMTKYLNTAKLTNTGKDSIYILEIAISDFDEEIIKPDLKEYKHDNHKE